MAKQNSTRYPHTFDLIIPTLCSCGNEALPTELVDKACKEASDKMARWFGGGFIGEVSRDGFYYARNRDAVDYETNRVIRSNATAQAYLLRREEFLSLAKSLTDRLFQQAIGCYIDGEYFQLDSEKPRCCSKDGNSVACVPVTANELAPTQEKLEQLRDELEQLPDSKDPHELICTSLSYPASDSIYSIKAWPESLLRQLAAAEAEVISECDGFQILLFRLAHDAFPPSLERAIAEKVCQEQPDWHGMIMVTTPAAQEWHFLNATRSGPRSPLRLRRLIARTTSSVNTVARRLAKLNLAYLHSTVTAAGIQRMHDDVFSVETDLDDFLSKYKEVFEHVRNHLHGFRPAQRQERHQFAQIIMNRLMFLTFIEKKRWLRFDNSPEYLSCLWDDYQRGKSKGDNFYRDRLQPLFFQALNTPVEQRRELTAKIGDVPYLNGGLFAETEWDRRSACKVPDECVRTILFDLFAHYDFTISESTEFDQDVAVDPEMLGHVFEELMTDEEAMGMANNEATPVKSRRKETGSYYTPKPVVTYMCREAIKRYLKMRLPRETASAIDDLVDGHDPSAIRRQIDLMLALNEVKICDPACGSGAYLLGMLHELLDVQKCLFNENTITPQSQYETKLDIIQTNLYGVDLNPVAVNIARLRLWLSLAIDYDGDTPPPLPNLDYKIEQGNSLTSLGPRSVSGQLSLQGISLEDFQELKRRYADPYDRGDRQQLLQEIKRAQQDIMLWANDVPPEKKGRHAKGEAEPFDWFVEFIEVFSPSNNNQSGGFDIIIANPPYVKAGTYRDDAIAMRQNYGDLYDGTADLYVYFFFRAIQLLRKNGVLVFITSDKWLKADYGRKLRTRLLEEMRIHTIIDFGSLPVFKGIMAYPMILLAQKGPGENTPIGVTVDSLEYPYPDIRSLVSQKGFLLPPGALTTQRWLLADQTTSSIIVRMEETGVPLRAYLGGSRLPVYSGIKTGNTGVFIIDDRTREALCTLDPRTAERLRPMARGRDIAKWRVKAGGRWLVHTPTPHGMAALGEDPIDIDAYPALRDYLLQHRDTLAARGDRGEDWWQLRPCAYYPVFAGPKILYQEMATYQGFAFDDGGLYVNNKVFMIPTDDLYLLGVLNSKWAWSYLQTNCTALNSGTLELKTPVMERLPIPMPSPKEREAIAALVRRCIEAAPEDRGELEAEIDDRVARLYGIDEA